MKTLKQIFFFIFALGLSLNLGFAAGTPAGTVIDNKATGRYKDVHGTPFPQVTSNIISITVAQVAGVALEPPTAQADIFDAGTVVFPLTLTNSGNGTDQFLLKVSYDADGGAVNTAKIYHDANGNAALDAGEIEMPKQGNNYESPLLKADSAYKMLVVVTNDSGAARTTNIITIEAGDDQYALDNGFDPAGCEALLTTKVKRPQMQLAISGNPANPLPGDEVEISLGAENIGNSPAYSGVFLIPIPKEMSYISGSMRAFGGPIDDDHEDELVKLTISSDSIVFNVSVFPAGNYGEIVFTVKVKDDVPANTEIYNSISATYKNEEETEQPPAYAQAHITIGQSFGVEVSPDSSTYVTPGDTVFYLVTVKNLGNAGNTFDISYENDMTDWEIYLDANGNGEIDDDEDLITDKTTVGDITLAAFQEVKLIARGEIPADAADREKSDLILTAVQQDDGDVSDNSSLSLTVRAPVLTLQKSVIPSGYQPPGTQLTYEVFVKNEGSGAGQWILVEDSIPEHTAYIAGSMKKGASGLTDAEDEDAGHVEKEGNEVIKVLFSLEEIEPEETFTFSFKVKIK